MRCKWFNVCPLRKFEDLGKIENKWKKEYCEHDYNKCERYKMVEKGLPHKDTLLPDGSYLE